MKKKLKLTSGEKSYLAGITGGNAVRTATRRHDGSTYRPAPVTLPRLAFLENISDDDANK